MNKCENCKHAKNIGFQLTLQCQRIPLWVDAPFDTASIEALTPHTKLLVSPWFGCTLFEPVNELAQVQP